ncbi:excalibur calcium-binding domain-containing protein [Saccharopolyspora terrae]|uniref:Excalibur calcium-binding domain-containing protein n=1 Tax=Saccharopolyspora terrae TaxID=2530384 RepID=A0A4R4VMK0_9PSEU|nr:excalibur calcium-binding domain-containing protein [Saccharopolyspora terrae]TDD07048.1 excalibur calcium-binding domain-containing protein [Saccharopolyspora terrae]
MRPRVAVAAGVLACGAALPLAGTAFAQDLDCADFATQPEAQEFFGHQGSGDPHRLDADDDGEACEDRPSGSDSSSSVAVPNEDGGGSDQGAMPSGGVEAGHGGMAENASDSAGQWSLAVGALLTASGVVVLRRRRVGGTG